MVALRSYSDSKPDRFSHIARRSLPAPRTLVVNRISELHRRLIDPASDVETVKTAKQSLLRLLSDPVTLPVIATPSMEMPAPPDADAKRKAAEAERVCEICDRPLPTQSPRESERTGQGGRKNSTRTAGADSFRSRRQNAMRRHPLSVRAMVGVPFLPTYSL